MKGYLLEERLAYYCVLSSKMTIYNSNSMPKEIDIKADDGTSFTWKNMPKINYYATVVRPENTFGTWDLMIIRPGANYTFISSHYNNPDDHQTFQKTLKSFLRFPITQRVDLLCRQLILTKFYI